MRGRCNVSAVAATHCPWPFGYDLLPLRCKITRQPAILVTFSAGDADAVSRVVAAGGERGSRFVTRTGRFRLLAAFHVHGSNVSSSCRRFARRQFVQRHRSARPTVRHHSISPTAPALQ